jgi:hypothetical protein
MEKDVRLTECNQGQVWCGNGAISRRKSAFVGRFRGRWFSAICTECDAVSGKRLKKRLIVGNAKVTDVPIVLEA